MQNDAFSRRPDGDPQAPKLRQLSHPAPPAADPCRGLQEAPAARQPRSWWQRLKHAFDYGSTGESG